MCGIAGFAGGGTREVLERMTNALAHRGPDDSGFFFKNGVGLGHRRLSIIDTSSRGHQPMSLPDESVVIILNGEIYNYQELKERLQKSGRTFVSDSDTEVLLHLYAVHGEDFLRDAVGMFALALYDLKKNTVLLARDRMGEKPLYWTLQNGALYFASEMKGVLAAGIRKELDLGSLSLYLQFDYVPTPNTILIGVHKLDAATMLMFRDGKVSKRTFWKPPVENVGVSEEDTLSRLDALLAQSVSRQLVADVPVGVFLSGGLDSSTVAYYAKKARQSVDTFSIGFDEPSFDESTFARDVATHLGTTHHDMVVRSRDMLDIVPSIADTLCEPLADASIVPTMLLSKFARQSVTVALGGDGSDELFVGYPTFQADGMHAAYRRLPDVLTKMIRGAVEMLPASHANFPLSYNLKKFVSTTEKNNVHRHLLWLGSFGPEERKHLANLSSDVFTSVDAHTNEWQGSEENKLLYAYLRSYLMDQVLVKVDRASMRYALETRAPFLDHTVVDYVLSLPYGLKYKKRTTKYLLKQLMHGKLPTHIVNRKKKGFGIPLARWLTKELRPLCEELLSKDALKKHGLFNESYVEALKDAHMAGTRDNRKELWNLMVFQLWYNRWMS